MTGVVEHALAGMHLFCFDGMTPLGPAVNAPVELCSRLLRFHLVSYVLCCPSTAAWLRLHTLIVHVASCCSISRASRHASSLSVRDSGSRAPLFDGFCFKLP